RSYRKHWLLERMFYPRFQNKKTEYKEVVNNGILIIKKANPKKSFQRKAYSARPVPNPVFRSISETFFLDFCLRRVFHRPSPKSGCLLSFRICHSVIWHFWLRSSPPPPYSIPSSHFLPYSPCLSYCRTFGYG